MFICIKTRSGKNLVIKHVADFKTINNLYEGLPSCDNNELI